MAKKLIKTKIPCEKTWYLVFSKVRSPCSSRKRIVRRFWASWRWPQWKTPLETGDTDLFFQAFQHQKKKPPRTTKTTKKKSCPILESTVFFWWCFFFSKTPTTETQIPCPSRISNDQPSPPPPASLLSPQTIARRPTWKKSPARQAHPQDPHRHHLRLGLGNTKSWKSGQKLMSFSTLFRWFVP